MVFRKVVGADFIVSSVTNLKRTHGGMLVVGEEGSHSQLEIENWQDANLVKT
jgi:hypothetical protein